MLIYKPNRLKMALATAAIIMLWVAMGNIVRVVADDDSTTLGQIALVGFVMALTATAGTVEIRHEMTPKTKMFRAK